MRKSHYLIASLLLMIGFAAHTAEAGRWSFGVVPPQPDCDCPGGYLTIWATHDCQLINPPIFGAPNFNDPGAEWVWYYAPPIEGTIPVEWQGLDVNDLYVVFHCATGQGDPPCGCPTGFVKVAVPVWDATLQQWVLLNLEEWLDQDGPIMIETPKLVSMGGPEIFIAINLQEWVDGGMPPMLPEYQIVNGVCPDLPGYLIGTTPITFDPGNPQGPFWTDPYDGVVYNHGVIDFQSSGPGLDIRPGVCPNPFNRGSNGVLPVAVLGTANFDVTEIDLASVYMKRADNNGGMVFPNFGPPGPSPSFKDVGTPFPGLLCDCHEEHGDGFMDLSLKFRSALVTDILMLDGLPPGAEVELCVGGILLDGSPFTACDCIWLVPPGSPPGMVNLRALNVKDAWIDVTPVDDQLDGGGFGEFNRSFPQGTVISVTAAPFHGGKSLIGWTVDGRPVAKHQTIAMVVVGSSQTIEAIYAGDNGDGVSEPAGPDLPTGDRPPRKPIPLDP